jgi:hypothetical protein
VSDDRKIIMVTDGEEDSGSDVVASAKKAIEFDKIQCNIFFVGIGQSPQVVAKCKKVADLTNGAYINLQAHNYNS